MTFSDLSKAYNPWSEKNVYQKEELMGITSDSVFFMI